MVPCTIRRTIPRYSVAKLYVYGGPARTFFIRYTNDRHIPLTSFHDGPLPTVPTERSYFARIGWFDRGTRCGVHSQGRVINDCYLPHIYGAV